MIIFCEGRKAGILWEMVYGIQTCEPLSEKRRFGTFVLSATKRTNCRYKRVEIFALASICAKVHPNGCDVLKKAWNKRLEKCRETGAQNFILHKKEYP